MAAGRIVLSTLMPARDRNDRLVAGAKLYVYTNRTTTPVTVYTTSALSTAQANPVVANSSGQFPDVWIEAGTAASPSLYTVSITGPNGESIANPSVFDDYSPSLNYASDVSSYWRALLLTASQSAFLTALGNIASSFINVVQSGTGAATRTLQAWFRERPVSVKDFGALGDGTTDDTAAVLAAYAAGNYDLYFPPGVYRLGQTGLLGAAGLRIRGAGRGANGLLTTIKPIATLTAGQAIFYNQAASPATSSFVTIEDVSFDLNAQNCVAIDLDRINNANINRVHFKGGASYAAAVGTGIRYNATTASGSYTNAATQCSFQYLSKGVEFGTDANSCSVFGGEFIGCTIGADCAPAGLLDTPRIFGARFEGGGVGIQDKAIGGNYMGCRFENNATADIEFLTGSERPMVVGGYTAASPTSLLNLNLATSPVILAPDMGRYDVEGTTGKKQFHGRHVFAAYNTALNPTVPTGIEYAAFFYDSPMIRNQISLEFGNATTDNSVISMTVDASNRTVVRSFDRKAAVDREVVLGGGSAVEPMATATTDIGSGSKRYKDGYFSGNLFSLNGVLSLEGASGLIYINGLIVTRTRRTGWATATGTATRTTFDTTTVTLPQLAERVKALIDDLHATAGHGLIGT